MILLVIIAAKNCGHSLAIPQKAQQTHDSPCDYGKKRERNRSVDDAFLGLFLDLVRRLSPRIGQIAKTNKPNKCPSTFASQFSYNQDQFYKKILTNILPDMAVSAMTVFLRV